ncbi:zinc-binding dehydrogenase [Sphingomonas histidinilytica]|jgi:NADPH:quinone reductase-like Zn-dependent oxidoreductase|uniref:NADPH:quinone reductase n=1 Tax=Rhizorhabdus histidinilytica TaxID=439228 RepID=A0A1T5CXJ0_9SPHN|nr:zinc-dependent alcohol dehydrogenase family protein [Rhizorhabdus histidinilytica]MBO9376299.1 zinc-binding dehydrogenase [Rhizorhabdus histidinilytica]QEH79107.1 zinc-dependent alcohol dehydrogenase family protein [Sphingomonas sp. C8-2]SKB64073.1 NADPH:quinone reductase [Rhizorhabdus histidinilytica]
MDRFRAVRFHRLGDPAEVLAIEELSAEPPADDEVMIRVDAFALNRADWLYCRGEHYSLPILPSRIGSECAGTVVAVGAAVDPALIGRRVCTVPFHSSTHGVQGEVATVPAAYVAPWPAELDAVEAASLWMQYLTAYFPLVEIASVGPSDHVLIPAASSSAGLAAIQVAKLCGARVIATSRTARKAASIREAGADLVVPLDGGERLSEAIDRVTAGHGVRVVFDPVAGPFMADYLDALADDARIFVYGLLSGAPTELDIVRLVRRAAIVHPYSVFNHVRHPDELRRGIAFVEKAVRAGLRPRIDSRFDFDDVLDAYRRLDSHDQIGKIVVRLDPA